MNQGEYMQVLADRVYMKCVENRIVFPSLCFVSRSQVALLA